MLTTSEIRQLYLDFFKSKQHKIVSSAPIVMKNDPTLMFTNAGMNQFKEYFLGNKTPTQRRVADTQKCLRVSGKHNDLEEVGKDTYHHTMFEMLGNWSFGDYFKEEAITWSWELLTDVYKIPKDKIYVSIFKGDEKEGLQADDEAKNIWKKYLPEDRILGFGKKDNFWEMGETGPCGPCSEIHVDCRSDEEIKKINGKDLVNQDDPLVIEIWNIVFIQYNRMKDGSLHALPQKHVDTGMGLERLVRVIQQKTSNYDTDIFINTFEKIQAITNVAYAGTDNFKDIAFRVIADHIRAICFAIADGQLPSNIGAGYVIRRILRRAVRYYYSHLNYEQALLFQLVPVIAKQFENVFPELLNQQDFVTKIIHDEENNFLKTISLGLKKLDTMLVNTDNNKEINGFEAFELYDTFGFPLDLTKMIVEEKGLLVNEGEFNQAMKEQKSRSRDATKTEFFDWQICSTEKSAEPFIGYDNFECKSTLLQYRSVQQKGNTYYQWVLLQTPFYAESGGQIGDTGVLIFDNESIEVIDTKKENDLILHITQSKPHNNTTIVCAKINTTKRHQTSLHHSATHLLHAALKQILGKHVHQKGAFLCDTYLRFDFSHTEKINDQQLQQIEQIVKNKIKENINITTQSLPKEKAIEKRANAFFGEKYGDIVRMVSIDDAFSLELCGGTHAMQTQQIGSFILQQESSVASGVRRIEATCGDYANTLVNEQLKELKTIKTTMQNPKELNKSIENLLHEKQSLQKQLDETEQTIAKHISKDLIKNAELQNGLLMIVQMIELSQINVFKKIAVNIKQSIKTPYFICVATIIENKINLLLQVDEQTALDKNIDLNTFAKQKIFMLIDGKGGGQKKSIALVGNNTNSFKAIKELIPQLLAF